MGADAAFVAAFIAQTKAIFVMAEEQPRDAVPRERRPPLARVWIASSFTAIAEADGAAGIVALNPLDRFAFPATDDARATLVAFVRQCAAVRFVLDPSVGLVAGESRAVFYEPTRPLRDPEWRPTIATPATIAWTVTGSGRAAVLSAVVATGSGVAAAITISPGLNDPEEVVFAVRLTRERSRLRKEELGIATDGPSLLRTIMAFRSGPVGTGWSGTLRLAALWELFAGPLVHLGRRDPLLNPSLVIDPVDSGRAGLSAALAAWGMD